MSEWGWWYSLNNIEWDGPYADRDEVTREGALVLDSILHATRGPVFYICQAQQHRLDTTISADVLLDVLDRQNVDFRNSNGVLFHVTDDEKRDLEELVKTAIEEWANWNNQSLFRLSFKRSCNYVRFDVTKDRYSTASRIYYHSLIAKMGHEAIWSWFHPQTESDCGLRMSYPLTMTTIDRQDPVASCA